MNCFFCEQRRKSQIHQIQANSVSNIFQVAGTGKNAVFAELRNAFGLLGVAEVIEAELAVDTLWGDICFPSPPEYQES